MEILEILKIFAKSHDSKAFDLYSEIHDRLRKCDKLKVLAYQEEPSFCVVKSFLSIIGCMHTEIETVSGTFNRSLSLVELEAMRIFNALNQDLSPSDRSKRSTIVSDQLLKEIQHIKQEKIIVNDNLKKAIIQKHYDELNFVNKLLGEKFLKYDFDDNDLTRMDDLISRDGLLLNKESFRQIKLLNIFSQQTLGVQNL